MSDTFDSSTVKTTHFKGSEDEAEHLRELKDRRGNLTVEEEEGDEASGERRHLKAKSTQPQSVLMCMN